MKKLLLTLALVGAVTAAYSQGSTQFSNSGLYKLSVTDGLTTNAVPITPGLMEYGMFFFLGGSTAPTAGQMTLLTSQFGVNSTTGAGLIASPTDGKSSVNLVTIPGSSINESDVWVQFRAWSATFGTDWAAAKAAPGAYFGQSAIRNVAPLGNTTGPGIALWTFATGTNPALIPAFVIPLNIVPEPTSLALFGLGASALLIFRRRK